MNDKGRVKRMKNEGGRMKEGPKQKIRTLVKERRGSLRHRNIFHFILHPSSFIPGFIALAFFLAFSAGAQTQRRIGAHSSTPRDSFTKADEALVQRAVTTTCSERVRDPFSSLPFVVMQARASLASHNP